ncbi:hypothetical protein B6U81_01395 [Thermoplasmatales archaeon ex4484_30]|nr:MAG: hypothetical protein B6U81_01395 [Thermoplasmatales archaeon ex4484_30]
MKKLDEIKKRLEEIEEAIRYNEALLEEIYETQDALFPIFADLVKLISRIYTEIGIKDDELKGCITRLRETFIDDEDEILHKYFGGEEGKKDNSIAYT